MIHLALKKKGSRTAKVGVVLVCCAIALIMLGSKFPIPKDIPYAAMVIGIAVNAYYFGLADADRIIGKKEQEEHERNPI